MLEHGLKLSPSVITGGGRTGTPSILSSAAEGVVRCVTTLCSSRGSPAANRICLSRTDRRATLHVDAQTLPSAPVSAARSAVRHRARWCRRITTTLVWFMEGSSLPITNVNPVDSEGHLQRVEEDPFGIMAGANSLARHAIDPVLGDSIDAVLVAAAICALAYEIKTDDVLHSQGRSLQLRCVYTFAAALCVTTEQRDLLQRERDVLTWRVVEAMRLLLSHRRVWACVEENVVVLVESQLEIARQRGRFSTSCLSLMVSVAHFLHNVAVVNPDVDVLVLARDTLHSQHELQDAFVLCCRLTCANSSPYTQNVSLFPKELRRSASVLLRNALHMANSGCLRKGVYADSTCPVGSAVAPAHLQRIVTILE